MTFNCQYDCAGDKTADPDCALKAEFLCENRPDGIPTFKKTYYCIKTNTTKSYEEIVKDEVIILCVVVIVYQREYTVIEGVRPRTALSTQSFVC